MADAKLDANSRATLTALSSVDHTTIVPLYADPTTHRLLVDSAAGTGTVTSVSVVSANGLAGTVATPTTTPAITLSTTVTGMVKGNGTAFSAATSGTDYAPGTSALATGIVKSTTATGALSIAVAGTDYSAGTSALATGILKSTTTTGALSIAVAGDFPTLNQNTTGTAAGLSATLSPASGGTGVANNAASTLAISGNFATTLTVSGITALTLPTSGTVTALGNTTTGSGSIVLATTPTLVTPVLGVATATTINKVTLTAPATGSTLTIADGKTLTANNSITIAGTDAKTLTVSNSITLAGTDATTMTFPTTSASIARTDAAQTFTGTQTFSQQIMTNNAITATANAATVPITSRISTVTNNSAAGLTITMTTTSAVDGMLVQVRVLDFSAVAQTITWVNTEVGEATPPATSNGSTTLPRAALFQFNGGTSKWRCIAA